MNKKKHPLYNKKFDELNGDEMNNITMHFFHPNKKWLHKFNDLNTTKGILGNVFMHSVLNIDWWMYGPGISDSTGYDEMKAIFKKHKLLKEFE